MKKFVKALSRRWMLRFNEARSRGPKGVALSFNRDALDGGPFRGRGRRWRTITIGDLVHALASTERAGVPASRQPLAYSISKQNTEHKLGD